MEKMYKILVERDGEYLSPFKTFNYGRLEEFIGKEMSTNCSMSDDDCDSGFYATTLQGLVYTNLTRKGSTVFEVGMGGINKKFNEFKHRFTTQKFLRIVPIEELKELVIKVNVGYDLYHALWPVNPLDILNDPSDEDWKELDKWESVSDYVSDSVGDSVGDSVWDSVSDSVWDSVRASVGDSVWKSVGDSVWNSVNDSVWKSVWDSVRAYVGSLFHPIKWKHIEHEEGVYPFQSAVNLWNRGFIPVKVEGKWGLYSSKLKKIIYND